MIDCHGYVGNKVTIVQNEQYLTLCEVKVYGNPVEGWCFSSEKLGQKERE